MMSEPHPDDVTLDAYVEQLLPPGERAAIDAHVAACARCRDEIARQRALLAGLHALPRAVEPDEDLRPGIRAAVLRRDGAVQRRRSLRALRLPLATAALLLVAVSAGVTALLLSSRERAPDVAVASHRGEVSPAAFDASRADYVRTAGDLHALLERHRDQLAPETIELVERNLSTIDQALREADAALRADPASPVLREMILATEEKKVEVLRWANSLVRG